MRDQENGRKHKTPRCFGHHHCGIDREDLAGKLEYCGRAFAQFAGRHYGQRKILRILMERSPISQKELQNLLGIQSGSMSEIAAKMEGRGLIVRGRDPEDKRKITLSVTDKGREWAAQRDEAGVRQRRAEMFSGLTQEERDTLEALLDKLAADWDRRMEQEQRDEHPQDKK